MGTDRLLRDIEKRLAGLDEGQRSQVLNAVRDELARGRENAEPGLTVEAERERRKEAETLREVLEAIIRQSRLRETIDEVLKQLSRVVSFDTCSLALAEPDGRLRIVGARGFEDPDPIVGLSFRDSLSDGIRANRVALSLADVADDDRFAKITGTEAIRSWAGIPLLVEGEVVGLISLDRHQVIPFDDDEMHRAKLVAFSAAAAIRKAQLLEQVRQYATAMERVVAVDHAVFAGQTPAQVLETVLEGALHLGTHEGGLLVLEPDARVAAARGESFEGSRGRVAPKELLVRTVARFTREVAGAAFRAAGLAAPGGPLYVVPVASADTYVGALALLGPDGETPDDRLMDSYASRAATAYLHSLRGHARMTVTSQPFGRYKVAEEVGRGAMGVVYRGVDPMIGRTVAIKAINVSYLDSVGVRTDEYLQRFQREAQVAGRLSHPAIVKIYDLGPNYLVMEFVEGQSLASLMRAKDRWPLSKVLQMIGETADALDYAHAQGIIHRDVKPANIMVQPDGSVKVMDFGLARIESSTLTAAGEILGSASYMAPELVLGRTATTRSDIFSLAVVVYELMTGDRPFGGGSVSAIIHKIVSEAPRPTGELALNLPPAYDTIFARALAKDPMTRHATASEFAGALSAAQWADRDPLLPDPLEPKPTTLSKRVDPAATLPPMPKQPAARLDDSTMMTADASEVAPTQESPLANLVSEPTDGAATLRAIPPIQLPEDAMADEKDETPGEVPATVILRPGAEKAPPAKAPEAEATSEEVPATVILKPGAAPVPPPPQPAVPASTQSTVIMKAAEPSTAATGRMAPAVSAAEEATAIIRPKPAAPPPPTAVPAPPPPPPAPEDTGRTGPIPVVAAPAATKPKGNGLVIGLVAGGILFLLLAVGAVIWVAKSFLSRSAAIAVTAPVESPATVAEVPPPPAAEPSPEVVPPEAPLVPEAAGESAPPPIQEPPAPTTPPSPATVMITSDPPGARVIVGKKERGVTPFRLNLPAGKASITVEKDGFKPFRKDLRLSPGKTETVEARLEAIPRETPPPPPVPTTLPPVRTGDLVALTPDVTAPKKLSGDSVKLRTSLPKKFNGSVVVEFIVDEDGKVRDPKVAESAGDPKVDGPCVDAVKTYRYEPATLRGVRVKVAQRARFTFQTR